jgi:hypothetical protein
MTDSSKVFIQTYGIQASNSNKMEWKGEYDSTKEKGYLDIIRNGKKTHKNITKKDILDIISQPSISQPLDQRLLTDFTNNQEIPVIKKTYKRRSNNKSRSRSKSKSKRRRY